jgi:hypothetical protein
MKHARGKPWDCTAIVFQGIFEKPRWILGSPLGELYLLYVNDEMGELGVLRCTDGSGNFR